MRFRRLRRSLIIRSALPVAVMAVWVGVLLWQIGQLVETAQWVDHTDQVLAEVSRTEADTAQRAAQLRGYLLTLSPQLLNEFNDGDGHEYFARLRELTADNPSQVARIRVAEQLHDRWESYARDAVRLASAGLDTRHLVLDEGIRSFDAVRQQLHGIRVVEEQLRAGRTARQAGMRRRVVALTSVSAVVLAIVLSALSWRQLTRVAARYAQIQAALEAEAAALREARGQLEQHADTLQRQVAQRTGELQRANAQLEAFAASVSHDLRAPLRGLQGLSQALIEDAGERLDPQSRDYATQIVHEAAAMDRLIQDLLEYSRLSRADLPLAAVPLADALKTAVHNVRQDIAERRATVSIDGPAPLVRANWSVLVQVFVNLLSNALKFSPGAPQVRIRIDPHDDTVRVWFEDEGIGVAAQHHQRIFDVFERLHGGEAYPGTGIGLAIVREGVERFGGRVGLESREGAGSKFWVELPPAQAA